MPKLVGKVARVRAPEVNGRVLRSMFGSKGEKGAYEQVVDEIKSLEGSMRWPYGKTVASWAEERRGLNPRNLGTHEERMLNFERNKVAFAEEVADTLWNPERNGMMAREAEIPLDIAEKYGKFVRKNPFWVYFNSMIEGESPYEIFLRLGRVDGTNIATAFERYVKSRPTWVGWTESGAPLEPDRVREYGRIYDAMTPGERKAVEKFVNEVQLPVESAVQMMSPEYYNWMKETGTPIYDVEFQQRLDDGSLRPTDVHDSGSRVRYMRDLDSWAIGLKGCHANGYVPRNSVRLVERGLPVRTDGRFLPVDLGDLVNNVQYSGTMYPYATRFYPGGSEGYLFSSGAENYGTNYGTWNPLRAKNYTGPNYMGRRLAFTVGGRPLVGGERISYFGDPRVGSKVLYVGRNGVVREINPEHVKIDDIEAINADGYGYFGDLSHQNQFAFGPGSSVKSLVGGSGNFDYRSPNIYERSGGTVEPTKGTARLARLFGFDGRRGAF